VPEGDGRLALEWEQLARLDTLTLDSLSATLDDALELLGGEANAPERQKLGRATLHVIEGGE
jgi:predicted ATPase